MNPRASVIIPVYNAEKTLRRCVESLVLGQERNVEVILCEDHSKDNSWNVCCELAAEYENVHCVRNEKNSGVSHTRNAALQEARGEYILFADSDDWVSRRYALELIKLAQKHPGALHICGHHFLDKVNSARHDYLWDAEVSGEVMVEAEGFFDLFDKFLLQQLWNKIFRRDLIEAHHIRFDESQSMGEDFQFVLDYMEAAQVKKCVVLNEPLYYYIRWNNTSLMSKFGFADTQSVFQRIAQMARIAGAGLEVQRDKIIAQTKKNYVFQITRNKNHSKREKLEAIERIMGDGNASSYYRQHRVQFAKEWVIQQLTKAKQLTPRVRGRMQRSQLQKRIAKAVKDVNAEGISFISQNCIGGVLYHDLGLQFLSPTINAFIPEPGFVKLVLNLRHYMEQELIVRWGEEYPIGTLDDVEIHFMHYDTCKEAKEAWDKRKARINWDKIFIIATDRNGFDDAVFESWKRITYPKVLFTAQKQYASDADSVFYAEYEGNSFVPDLIPNRAFYRDGILVKKVNYMEGHL